MNIKKSLTDCKNIEELNDITSELLSPFRFMIFEDNDEFEISGDDGSLHITLGNGFRISVTIGQGKSLDYNEKIVVVILDILKIKISKEYIREVCIEL